MSLAIFDLDNTLIGGDSDYLWGQYLSEIGAVDSERYRREHDRFYDEYLRGVLDIYEFLRFQLEPLKHNSQETLHRWRRRFVEEKIRPLLLPKAVDLLDRHRRAGDTLLIITATNRFITEPIAEALGVEHLIATEPEFTNGRYTGEVTGLPSYAAGKVERLRAWMAEFGAGLEDSWFYSDSHNDLPLLEIVTHPVAVDPDQVLRKESLKRNWPVISLR